MGNKNAITPVIAIIILIVGSIGVSALLYSWYSGIQKGTSEAPTETAGRTSLDYGTRIVITDGKMRPGPAGYTCQPFGGPTLRLKGKNIGSTIIKACKNEAAGSIEPSQLQVYLNGKWISRYYLEVNGIACVNCNTNSLCEIKPGDTFYIRAKLCPTFLNYGETLQPGFYEVKVEVKNTTAVGYYHVYL